MSKPKITMEARIDSYTEAISYMIDHCKQVLTEKHHEYATTDDFHNFRVAADIMGSTIEQALASMMCKHTVSIYDLIAATVNGQETPLETWKEKIGDHINYLLILWAYEVTKNTTK